MPTNSNGLEFNVNSQRRVPITRNNLFFSDESFQFEMEMGKCYVEQDMNQTVILYRVNQSKTNINSIYGETSSNGISYKTPVELHVVYLIDEPELKSYDKTKNLGTYMKTGKLSFGVYPQTLQELGVEINVGDYIGVVITEDHMEYFSVVSINKGFDNKHSLYGFKTLWYEVKCASVDENEFNG
jgi:hypothetical protein